MADNNTYLTVGGVVQFEPRPARQAGQDMVKSVTIQNLQNQKNISVDLWGDMANLEVNKGDVVFASGKYKSRTVQKDNGDSQTYHSVSANSVTVIPFTAVSSPRGSGNVGVSEDAVEAF